MSKNNNSKKQNNMQKQEVVENQEEVKVQENASEVIKETPQIPEHSDRIIDLVRRIDIFVDEFNRGWSIKRLEPLKEEIKAMLEENKEKENLSKSDKNFLYYIRDVIYGKTPTPAWKRNSAENEQEKPNNRPENARKQMEFKDLRSKINALKKAIDGYGNKAIITTIEDIKENSFYCLKEVEIEGKMELECSLKFTKIDGIAKVDAMTPEEAFAIRDSYREIKDNPEEKNTLAYYERTINNNPTYADNYFLKIATAKEQEAQCENTEVFEQDMQE